MMVFLENVLTKEDVAKVRAELGHAVWKEGRTTAGLAAQSVKNNLQALGTDPRILNLEKFVVAALSRHPVFAIAARPRKLSRLLFSKYQPGMTYGPHTDDPLMGAEDHLIRVDLAFTLFLSPLDSYEGGALIVDSPAGEQSVKLKPGDAVVYPASSIHRVEPVTSGERWAAVGWIQSLVREAGRREILFDLATARARLAAKGADRDDLLLLEKVAGGLMRLWAEP
jgi:PKHD-type hydroxylase